MKFWLAWLGAAILGIALPISMAAPNVSLVDAVAFCGAGSCMVSLLWIAMLHMQKQEWIAMLHMQKQELQRWEAAFREPVESLDPPTMTDEGVHS